MSPLPPPTPRAGPAGAVSPARSLPPPERHCLSGWGESVHGFAEVIRPRDAGEVAAVMSDLARRGRPVALRGSGRSYGDAALATGGEVLDLRGLDRIEPIDRDTGRVRVGAGVTIETLWRAAIPLGYWPAVVPGTMLPTVGGCVAMNVHGKNQYRAGVFGEHVDAFEMVLADGSTRRVTRDEELFRAVHGGFGMLGIVTAVELRLERVHSGRIDVTAVPCPSLADMLAAFEEREASADYLVGWIDAFDRNDRGLMHAARHFGPGEDAAGGSLLTVEAQELPGRFFGVVPRGLVGPLLQPFGSNPGVAFVNRMKYASARLSGTHRFRQSHAAFAFLLDYVPEWKRIYDPGGLLQYQTFVPKAVAAQVHGEILARCRKAGQVAWLAVLKRHKPDDYLMSHTLDGYSLALDFPVRPDNRDALFALCHELDRLVLGAGGRFYLAKDLTAEPASLRAAYPGLGRFLEWKRKLDPDCVLRTDMSRRLGVTA